MKSIKNTKEKTPSLVNPRNKLNNLTGTEWIKFLCSFFIFNALASDLKEERLATDGESADHPATYSPTMMESFINFFTKPGQVVLDPFVGIGSTLVACDRTKRQGIGIELSPKYAKIASKRTKQKIIIDDAINIDKYKLPMIDYCVSSPPYWDVLNRSTKDFKKNRDADNHDSKYSEDKKDLGNINDYEEFLDALYKIYEKIYVLLKPGAYITIIIKNVKKKGKYYPLAWDLAKKLSTLYELKDEKIWIQDKVRLAPYGYPYAWVSNILHHYCLILRKEK